MNKEQSVKKVVVVGLDGATFDVLDPYMDKGDLPNLAKISKEGARGILDSSIPPVTGPSWVSFMTGKNPGKHGIFDFVKPEAGGIKRYPVNYRHIKSKTIWNLLSDAGKKVGVVNMPLTYPPPEVDGFFITGLLTPADVKKICYPENLIDEVTDKVGPYTIDVWWQYYGERNVEKFMDDLMKCTEQRIKTFDYLMKNKQWDLFAPIFIGTDRIQHFLWKYIHPKDPAALDKREKFFVSRIRDYYMMVDEYLGKLMNEWGEEANIFVISDHGFGPLTKKMYVNRWLHQEGYLSIKGGKSRTQLFLRSSVLKLKKIVRAIDKFNIRKLINPFTGKGGRMGAYDFLSAINWPETKAYSVSSTEQGIYLNLKGREPDGIVDEADYEKLRDEIIASLKELRDPDSGEKVVSHTYKREDLYNGPYVKNAPDIIFFIKGGEYLADVQLKEKVFENGNWTSGSGTHRMEGIVFAYGPDIKSGATIKGAQIMDLAPTILRLQDIPIPKEMDGKVLEGVIKEDFLKSHLPVYSDEEGAVMDSKADDVLSDEDKAEMERRLKGLGYL